MSNHVLHSSVKMDHVLLSFSKNDADRWTIDDAFKGVSIMGGTGSGKTSASGKKLALQYLKQGWGGLVLCAKTDEATLWQQYCKETGRENDLIIFGKEAVHASGINKGQEIVFNPIDYEMKREGKGAGETQNITNIFMNMYRLGNRISGEGDTKEERYWDTALKRCLNRVVELIKLSGEDLSYSNMVKLLASTANLDENKFDEEHGYLEDTGDPSRLDEDDRYCTKCLIKAYYKNFKEKEATLEEENAYNLVYEYFLSALPNMGDKTKSVVTESFMGLAEPFLSGLLYRHFSGVTNIFPEWTYQQNKIIVMNFPVKEFLESGIVAQCLFKLLFQQAVERRNIKEYPTPVFLWADEAQYFINPYDQIFLTTARSSRAATVFLSQNISNYLAVMGTGQEAKPKVDSLMGNLSTKIFHANSDAETNEYASKLLGSDIIQLKTSNNTQGFLSLDISQTQGVSPHLLPQILPMKFTMLRSGGINNDYNVDACVFVTGKKWSNGKNYFEAVFKQTF